MTAPTIPTHSELRAIRQRQPREDAFAPAFYDSLVTHALDALREGRRFELNADGAWSIIQQAHQDRKDVLSLLDQIAALQIETAEMRAQLESRTIALIAAKALSTPSTDSGRD